MARLIWSEPALADLETIADYIALDKPDAAARIVQQVFARVERLIQFPKSGGRVPELPDLPYRQLVVPPYRIFYRMEGRDILIVFIMRGEQRFRGKHLIERDAE